MVVIKLPLKPLKNGIIRTLKGTFRTDLVLMYRYKFMTRRGLPVRYTQSGCRGPSSPQGAVGITFGCLGSPNSHHQNSSVDSVRLRRAC
jgi:hypothetical protein